MENVIEFDIYEDKENEGIAKNLAKALSFDLVHPTKVWGDFEIFCWDVEIDMSNGDNLLVYYETSPNDRNEKFELTINNNVIDLTKDEKSDDPMYVIRKTYKEHILNKIKNA